MNNDKIKIPVGKRIFDIIASLIIIILLSPVIILILLAMLVEHFFIFSSRGPVLYSEIRISQGEPFKLFKFRIFKKDILKSILQNGDYIHTKDLEKNKSNMTYTGRFLKKIYFDELPQIINVLKGEMSIVGPRPTNILNSRKLYAQGHFSKFLLKAGMTGYYQTHKGVRLGKNQEELDMLYADLCKNKPGWKIFLYDIKIIIITIITVLRAEGL